MRNWGGVVTCWLVAGLTALGALQAESFSRTASTGDGPLFGLLLIGCVALAVRSPFLGVSVRHGYLIRYGWLWNRYVRLSDIRWIGDVSCPVPLFGTSSQSGWYALSMPVVITRTGSFDLPEFAGRHDTVVRRIDRLARLGAISRHPPDLG